MAKIIITLTVVVLIVFGIGFYSSGAFIRVGNAAASNNIVENSANLNINSSALNIKIGQTNFIGEYTIGHSGIMDKVKTQSHQSGNVKLSFPNLLVVYTKQYKSNGVVLTYNYGKIGNLTFRALTYVSNNSFFGIKLTDMLINRGPAYNNSRLSVMAIAFQPNQGKDLHLGNLLITNFSSSLKGQFLGIQSGIFSLGVRDMGSGNQTLFTLGIYYLLAAESISSFIKITPNTLLSQKVDITGVYLVDGNLAACIAELVSLGIAGAALVAEASACFTGVGFGIPCALFFITVNALPIVEVIAIHYAC